MVDSNLTIHPTIHKAITFPNEPARIYNPQRPSRAYRKQLEMHERLKPIEKNVITTDDETSDSDDETSDSDDTLKYGLTSEKCDSDDVSDSDETYSICVHECWCVHSSHVCIEPVIPTHTRQVVFTDDNNTFTITITPI